MQNLILSLCLNQLQRIENIQVNCFVLAILITVQFFDNFWNSVRMENFINLEYDILQAELERLEGEIEELTVTKKQYKIKARIDPFIQYSEEEFRQRYRLTKDTVRYSHHIKVLCHGQFFSCNR